MAGSIRKMMPPTDEELSRCFYPSSSQQYVAETVARLVAERAIRWAAFAQWYNGQVVVYPYRIKQYQRLNAAWKAAADRLDRTDYCDEGADCPHLEDHRRQGR